MKCYLFCVYYYEIVLDTILSRKNRIAFLALITLETKSISHMKGNMHIWLERECLNVGTVPKYKMHNIGTVPTLKMHNVGTVPMFKMHSVGTPKI